MLRRQESSIRSEMNIRLLSLEDQIINLTHRVHTLENSSQSSPQVSSHTSTTSRTGSLHVRHPQSSRDIHRRSSLQNHPNPSNTLPFRIIWGTQRSCTSQVVWKAITALLPTHVHSSIVVKRSSRHKEAKLIWWFTIMAPSAVMQQVEEIWSYLVVRSGWSLRTSLYTTQQSSPPVPPVQQSSPPVPSSGASAQSAVLHSPSHLISGTEPTMSESPPSITNTNVGNPVILTADGQHNLISANPSPQCSANSSLNRSCSGPPSVSQPSSIPQPGPVASSASKDSHFLVQAGAPRPHAALPESRVEGAP